MCVACVGLVLLVRNREFKLKGACRVATIRVLEFLIPILYPEIPTRVTIIVENMIFGTVSDEQLVDWVIFICDVVERAFIGIGKSKATPICLYIFHLYYSTDNMLPDEKKAY